MAKFRDKADAAFESVVGGLSRSRFGQGVNSLSKKQAPDWLANSGDAVYSAGEKVKNFLAGPSETPEGDFTKMKRKMAMNKRRGIKPEMMANRRRRRPMPDMMATNEYE